MTITLKLKPWVEIDGFKHISTDWQIASDLEFTNIIEDVIETEEYLNIYFSTVSIPNEKTYYIRSRRKLSDGTNTVKTTWTTTQPIINTEQNVGLLILEDIYIEKPLILISKKDIEEIDSGLKISLSKFRSKNDAFKDVSIAVLDSSDKMLYSDLHNTSITDYFLIDKKLLIDKSNIKVCIGVTGDTGVFSGFNCVDIKLSDINYEITSNLDRVAPYSDYDVKLVKLNELIDSKLIKFDLIDIRDETIIFTNTITDTGTNIVKFTIPGLFLDYNNNYYLDVYSTTNSVSNYRRKRKLIKTINNIDVVNHDKDFKYGKLTKLSSQPRDYSIPTNTQSFEHNNSIIPMAINNSKYVFKAKFNLENSILSITQGQFPGLSVINGNNESTFLKLLPNGYFLIDTLTVDTETGINIPIFSVYSYNYFLGTSTLLHTYKRTVEHQTIGFHSSYIVSSNNTIVYIPVGSNKLMEYDFVNNTLIEISTTPLEENKLNYIFQIQYGRYIVFGGDSNGYIYNTTTRTYTEGFTIPEEFRNRKLKIHKLINGDLVITKLEYVAIDENLNNVLYYNSKENLLIEHKPDYEGNVYLDSSILLKTGELVLINIDDTHFNYYIFKNE